MDTNNSGALDPGDKIEYTFTVTNSGNVTMQILTIDDSTLGVSNLAINPQILAPDEVGIATYTYSITQADIDAGAISNTAVVNGVDVDGEPESDDSDDDGNGENDPTVTDLDQSPSIETQKTQTITNTNSDGIIGGINDVINYTITVTNTGNVTLTDVEIVDTFTDIDGGNLTLTAGPTYQNADEGSSVGTLIPGETATYTASYTIAQTAIDAGGLSNSVVASGTAPDTTTIVTDVSDDGNPVDTDGDGTPDNDPTEFAIQPNPSLEAIKTVSIEDVDASTSVTAGDVITYTITVENTGNVTLESISLADELLDKAGNTLTLDSGPTFDSGNSEIANATDPLAPDQLVVYTAIYTLQQNDIDIGGVSNSVTATGTSPDTTVVNDTSDDGNPADTDGDTDPDNDPTETLVTENPSIEAVKEITPITDPMAGDEVIFTITVTNTGNVTLNNVSLEDTFTDARGETLALDTGPDYQSTDMTGGADGTLRIGETATYLATYDLEQKDIDAGGVSNSIKATGTSVQGTSVSDVSDDGDDEDGNTTNDKTNLVIDEDPSIEIVKPDPAIVQNDGNTTIDVGDVLTYTLTVTNTGNVTLRNIEVTDTIEDANGIDINPNPVPVYSSPTGTEGILLPSEAATYTVNYTITQSDVDAGGVSNQAFVESMSPNNIIVTDVSDNDDGVGNMEDDPTVTEIPSTPSIAIVKTASLNDEDSDGCTNVGETISYTFTVTNTGNVSLFNLNITDPSIQSSAINFESGDTDNDNALDVTETWTYTASYVITQDNIDVGTVSNQASIGAVDPNATSVTDLSGTAAANNEITETSLCQDGQIALVKTGTLIDANGNECDDAGETISYSFVLTNIGNVSLHDLEIEDPLLGSTPYTLVSGDTDGDNQLDVTEVWTFTAPYILTQSDINSGSLTNQATVTALTPSPNNNLVQDISGTANDNNTSTVTNFCQNTSMSLVKEAVFNDENSDGCTDLYETISYSFTLTNTGNITLSNIVVTDPILANLIFEGGDENVDGALDIDETWEYTATYTIIQDDMDAGNVTNQATVSAVDPYANPVSSLSGTAVDNNNPTVTNLCQETGIALVKEASLNDENSDGCTDINETITYTFTVTNTGNVSLLAPSVSDPMVASVAYTSGDLDNDNELDITETWSYTASHSITQEDTDAGLVSNRATVSATTLEGDPIEDFSGTAIDNDDFTETTLCQESGIALVKGAEFVDADGDNCADAGETINYTFTITNTGNVSLSNVTLTDPSLTTIIFDSGDTDSDDELDATESWIYTASYIITQEDIDAGVVSNEAMVTANDIAGDPLEDHSGTSVDNNEPTVIDICQEAGIALVKEAEFVDTNSNDCADVGETIDYTFTITNTGNVSLSEVVLSDPALALFTLESGDDNSDSKLDVTETWIYTGTYSVTQADVDAGLVNNQATVTAKDTAGDIVEDLSGTTIDNDDITETPLCQETGIALVKEAEFVDTNGDNCADVGETIDYTFTITNTGNVSLSEVVLSDPALALFTLESGDDNSDSKLDVTETWIYTGTYSVTQADVDAGLVNNQATVTAKDTAGDMVEDLSGTAIDNDDITETPLCQEIGIALVKEAEFVDTNGNNCADVGETIDYTFTVVNTGNVTLSRVDISNTLSSAITYESGDVDNDNELDTTEEWIYTGVYTINQVDIDTGEISNQATVTAFDSEDNIAQDISGTAIDNDDATETVLCQQANLALEKTGVFNDVNGNGYSDLGETVTYSFTITNTGNVTINGIEINDALVTVNGGPINLAPGETDTTTFSAVYTITEEDINNGVVTNSAIATGTDLEGNPISDTSDDPTNPTDEDIDDDGDPEDTTETVIPAFGDPSLEVTKYAEPVDSNEDEIISAGEIINYTITVENTGQVTVNNVSLIDVMTNGFGASLQLTTGPSFEGATSNSVEGILQVGEIATYLASYTVTEEDVESELVSNSVTATGVDINGKTVEDQSDNGDDTDGNTTDDNTNVNVDMIPNPPPPPPLFADIKVTKEAFMTDNGDGKPSANDIIDYTITVTNTGEVALTNVTLTDMLTDGNDVSLDLTIEPTFDSATLGSAEGELKVSETARYYASYTLKQNDINTAAVKNVVEARAFGANNEVVSDISDNGIDDDGNTEDDPTIIDLDPVSSISLIKEALFIDENNDGYASVGETIEYRFSVTNTGDVDLFNVEIVDKLEGVEIDEGLIPVLRVGETDNSTITATYTITEEDLSRGSIENQAEAIGENLQGSRVSDYSDDPNNIANEDINGDGDPDDTTVLSLITEDCNVVVYDIVSPDGDGIADVLTISGLDCYPDNTLEIYNRWGIRVFWTKGYGTTGDLFRGYSDGRVTIQRNKKLPTGTYYYVLNYVNDGGVTIKKAGPIFVIND